MKNDTTTRQLISPFSGEPFTTPTWDENGQPAFAITIHEITPEGAKSADGLASLLTFLLWILTIYLLAEANTSSIPVWIVGLIAPLFAHRRFLQFFYNKLAETTKVLFTPTEFQVKSKNSQKVYDRTHTHSFSIMKHDEARNEREMHERQAREDQMNKRIVVRKRYYDDSYHVIFMYMGHRVDVVTIYDQKRATAVAARLKACDKVMDNKNQMGNGEVLSPGEQWGETPGKLPLDL